VPEGAGPTTTNEPSERRGKKKRGPGSVAAERRGEVTPKEHLGWGKKNKVVVINLKKSKGGGGEKGNRVRATARKGDLGPVFDGKRKKPRASSGREKRKKKTARGSPTRGRKGPKILLDEDHEGTGKKGKAEFPVWEVKILQGGREKKGGAKFSRRRGKGKGGG